MDFKVVFGFDLLGVLLGMKFRTNWYQNFVIWLRNEGFRLRGSSVVLEKLLNK